MANRVITNFSWVNHPAKGLVTFLVVVMVILAAAIWSIFALPPLFPAWSSYLSAVLVAVALVVSLAGLKLSRDLFITVKNVGEETENIVKVVAQVEELKEAIESGIEKQSETLTETASSLSEMAASIEEIARGSESLSSSVEQTASSITEMASSIAQVAESAEELNTSAIETSTSIEQMNASIQEVGSNILETNRAAEMAVAEAEAGGKAVKEMINEMGEIAAKIKNSSQVVQSLGESSERISKITKVIDDIAKQTDLLALNAAIEAARAGEHGRGFAVVADEIRKLAERSGAATREIASLIQGIQEEVATAVEASESGAKRVEAGLALADKAGEALNRIIEAIASVTSLSSEIATATQEQARGSQLILKAAERMSDLALLVKNATKEQSVGSEQIRQAVEEMEKLTINVTAAVEQQRKCSSDMLKIVEQAEQFNGENLEPLNRLKELAENLKEQLSKLVALTNRLD